MEENASHLTPWVPVIGALAGGILVLLGSIATAWFNKSTERRLAKEARERERLEEVYATLVTIRSQYGDMLAQALNKIHHNAPLESSTGGGMPPILRLQMLVDMYCPSLRPSFNEFEAAKNKFGEEYAKIIGSSFSGKQLKEKQELSGKFVALIGVVERRITEMQKAVAELVKA